MQQLTVKQLKVLCTQAIQRGHGDKLIVISDDNEGNGYHGLFYGFTLISKDDEQFYNISDSTITNRKEIIVLG